MKCLCCGKPIIESASETEKTSCWHNTCIKKFFETTKLPDIDISEEVLEQLATESTNKGYTVPGVQKKLSLHLTTGSSPRLTLVNYPTGYILKPQTSEYCALPEAEYLIMQMAAATGIMTVPFAMVRLASQNNSLAYITKRIDRILPNAKNAHVQMLAMEDFCQLDGRLTQDKYHGSYERCAKIISRHSMRPGLDLTELFLRIVFSYTVGNSDMHLKNFSLIETSCGSKEYVLSDAYDMLPVNIILPEDPDQFALTMNGKKRNLRKKDFIVFAEAIGVTEKSAKNLIQKVVSMKGRYLSMCRESYLPENMKNSLQELITSRIAVLEQ